MANDKEQEERRKHPEKYEKKPESQMFKGDGEIRQCNEGNKLKFIKIFQKSPKLKKK